MGVAVPRPTFDLGEAVMPQRTALLRKPADAVARTPGPTTRPELGADPELSATFAVPALPDGLVRRPRLLHLVTEGLRRPLLVVNGPAGAGKSLLVADW